MTPIIQLDVQQFEAFERQMDENPMARNHALQTLLNRPDRLMQVTKVTVSKCGSDRWDVYEPSFDRTPAVYRTFANRDLALAFIREQYLTQMPDYCPELLRIPATTNLLDGSVTYDLTLAIAYMHQHFPAGWDEAMKDPEQPTRDQLVAYRVMCADRNLHRLSAARVSGVDKDPVTATRNAMDWWATVHSETRTFLSISDWTTDQITGFYFSDKEKP